MSGDGRCKFTDLHIDPDNYISSNPHFVKSALSSYTQWDFITLVEKHGIAYHEKTLGQLFCDKSSKQILEMLLTECEEVGVEILTRCQNGSVEQLSDGYSLQTSLGEFGCHSLVVATGELSIPTMGATGFGYELAEQFGLDVLDRSVALVPFTFSDQWKSLCGGLAGLSTDVVMAASRQSFREGLLFTHRGLSGPVSLQVSSYWSPGQPITINLIPECDASEYLLDAKGHHGKSLVRTVLRQLLPKTLVNELEALLWSSYQTTPLAEMPDAVLRKIGSSLFAWTLNPSGTEGYRTTEVTLRGVDTRHISSKTMECFDHRGLYFIGEVVDVTGHLGGYHFQWAWSSGYAAGSVV